MIEPDEYLYFCERALDGMHRILGELGDAGANTKPLEPTPTPYALMTHCLGVVEYWSGHLVAGREVARNRSAEFEASGAVASLADRFRSVVDQFRIDVLAAEYGAPLSAEPPADFLGPDRTLTQGAALQHIFEELAQHHGQMEIIRDAIEAGNAA